jgi:hypothetical protein
MKKEMIVCDDCGQHLSHTQCKICSKELCLSHTYNINISIYNPKNHWGTKEDSSSIKIDCDYTHPNSKPIKVCGECKGRFTHGLEAIKSGDLEFFLFKMLELITECAKVEVI